MSSITSAVWSSSFSVEPEAGSTTPMKKHVKKLVSVTDIFHFQLQLLSKIQCNRSEIFTASPVKLILHAKALKIEGRDSVNKTKRSIRKERHQERNNYNRKEKETKRQVGISFVLNFCVAVSQARLTMVLIESNFCLRVLFLIYFCDL